MSIPNSDTSILSFHISYAESNAMHGAQAHIPQQIESKRNAHFFSLRRLVMIRSCRKADDVADEDAEHENDDDKRSGRFSFPEEKYDKSSG